MKLTLNDTLPEHWRLRCYDRDVNKGMDAADLLACPADSHCGREITKLFTAADALLAIMNGELDQRRSVITATVHVASIIWFG